MRNNFIGRLRRTHEFQARLQAAEHCGGLCIVEPGETLEGCILREIEEEVGIAVDNIRYFGSQPWPFPDSLMVAFLAVYAGGEIQVDGSEITEAKWFSREDLPNIPPNISIARRLIDWFTVNNC